MHWSFFPLEVPAHTHTHTHKHTHTRLWAVIEVSLIYRLFLDIHDDFVILSVLTNGEN